MAVWEGRKPPFPSSFLPLPFPPLPFFSLLLSPPLSPLPPLPSFLSSSGAIPC